MQNGTRADENLDYTTSHPKQKSSPSFSNRSVEFGRLKHCTKKALKKSGKLCPKTENLFKLNRSTNRRGKGVLKPSIAILMGSDSDLKVMKEAAETLEQFGIEYSMRILSAHRTPSEAADFAQNAHTEFECIICGAGLAAHLAGAIAARTHLPVIGVPLASGALNGQDALYATVQMPPGVPVASVGIDNAKNAALFAIQILSRKYPEIEHKLVEYRKKQSQKTIEKAQKLEEKGWKQFLEEQQKT